MLKYIFYGKNTSWHKLLPFYFYNRDRCRSGSIGLGHIFAAAFTHSVAVGRRTEGQNIDGISDEEKSTRLEEFEEQYQMNELE